jgi:hypothetical protein
MKLDSFKELLLKKANDNENLSTLIKFIDNDILADEIIESLEKMADHKGNRANSAVTSFAGSATKIDTDMLHDAISHHLSRFAAANKASPPQKTQRNISQSSQTYVAYDKPELKNFTHNVEHYELHPTAKKHLERAMHLADLAAKASKHSLGKLNFDHVPTHAWEMNVTGDHVRVDKNGNKKYVDDQQGLKRRTKEGGKFPDYSYLLLTPHKSYKKKSSLRGHSGQYPFEEMKINDKYVHIDTSNIDNPLEYKEHEFDMHPLFHNEGSANKYLPAWEKPEDHRSDADRQKYADALSNWHESDHVINWLNRHEKMEQANPELYAARGSKPSKLLEGVSKEVKQQPREEKASGTVSSSNPSVIRRTPEQQKQIKAAQPEFAKDQSIKDIVNKYKSGDAKTKELLDALDPLIRFKLFGV